MYFYVCMQKQNNILKYTEIQCDIYLSKNRLLLKYNLHRVYSLMNLKNAYIYENATSVTS